MFSVDEIIRMFPQLEETETEVDDEIGELSVLNCAAGDINIKFDKDDPKDVENARKIIQDMQRRGYVIFIQDGKETKRVDGFDPKTCEYLLREPETETPIKSVIRVARRSSICYKCHKPIEAGTSYYELKIRKTHISCGEPVIEDGRKKRQRQMRRVPMTKTKATGIAPTSGG